MIDVIRQQLKAEMTDRQKENMTREFLQILCLKLMHDKKMFEDVAFLGGTLLRLLFDMRRFSEDLDFSLIRPGDYAIAQVADELVAALRLYGFSVEAKVRMNGAVQSCLLKFEGLLKELGLSPLKSQKLSIKIDVDTRPPDGWTLSRTLVSKTFVFTVTHYDQPSLFAGKLHACFYRTYTKGRDFYDLFWYLGKKVRPNFLLLNNAVRQTQGIDAGINEGNWKYFLLEKVKNVDMIDAREDVRLFLEDDNELRLFDAGILSDAIKGG